MNTGWHCCCSRPLQFAAGPHSLWLVCERESVLLCCITMNCYVIYLSAFTYLTHLCLDSKMSFQSEWGWYITEMIEGWGNDFSSRSDLKIHVTRLTRQREQGKSWPPHLKPHTGSAVSFRCHFSGPGDKMKNLTLKYVFFGLIYIFKLSLKTWVIIFWVKELKVVNSK